MPWGLKLFKGINIQCCHAHFMSKSKSHEHLTSKEQRNEISSIYLKGKLENLRTVLKSIFLLISSTRLDFPEGQRPSCTSLEICVTPSFTRHLLFIKYCNLNKKQNPWQLRKSRHCSLHINHIFIECLLCTITVIVYQAPNM